MQPANTESYWAKNASTYDKATNYNMERVVARIGRHMKQSTHLLDIAAGTGMLSLRLAKYAQQVDAIDLEERMIAVAQKKAEEASIANVSFQTQSAYRLDFPDHTFDAIVILNSLHVMKTPDLALLEARRVIKPTGLLITPTWCHAETKESLANYQNWASKSGHTSHHLFTCATLCDLVCSCDFSITERDLLTIKAEKQLSMILGFVVARPTPEK